MGISVYLGQAHNGSSFGVERIGQSFQPHKKIKGRLREGPDKGPEKQRVNSAFLANLSHEIRRRVKAIIRIPKLLTCDVGPFNVTGRQE